ncbi:response regulator [Parablautia intestinalis]|uniref:Stage 0 sporulation protein A homolog n=1 Tax=Parablautia intestinalis TaxID=2320100 RepID=A0A3A9AP43_9FIRM|nr:response regulator [Parablautia intestinalis]RKI93162.1 response regulator [Parablautia intestinalis]
MLKMNILIVDDERLILTGLKSCIEKIADVSCTVQTSTSGRQALQILEFFPADLMITDVEMPGISGLDLIMKARQQNLCHRFMILSGYDKFEYARTAIKYGVKDYLLKPVDKDELRASICTIAREMKEHTDLKLIEKYNSYFPHIGQESIPSPLQKCVSFIAANYNHDISLSMLSEHIGKTENYICNLFRKEWDTTFLEIVNETRLREALYLLIYQPSLPIRDISLKVGYKTERQLFRLFKTKLGLTPLQIRNSPS